MAESLPITLTARHASGFEICLNIASLDVVDETIAHLLQRGYRPTGTGDGYVRTAEGLPFCPRHKVPMRLRNKQNQEWFSHGVVDKRTGEIFYCKGYKSPSSPGWEIDGTEADEP